MKRLVLLLAGATLFLAGCESDHHWHRGGSYDSDDYGRAQGYYRGYPDTRSGEFYPNQGYPSYNNPYPRHY